MSEPSSQPRRSQREKKQSRPFAAATLTSTRKRKRSTAGTENELAESDIEEDQNTSELEPGMSGVGSDENDDEEEDYSGKGKSGRSRKKATTTKAHNTSKRIRTPKSAAPKPRKNNVPSRRGRKVKDDALYDPEQVAKDTKINSDNPLFNAIMNPSAALQGKVDDFLESLSHNEESALAELINLILRACGCNDSVNSDEVVDHDGVLDALDTFTEGLKKDDSPTYPLSSKLAPFKKFRTHLSEFLSRLIVSAADLNYIYSTSLMQTFQAWIVAMSSSHIRSFRHTATVVALDTEAALCDVAKEVEKELEMLGRQRDGDKKRKGKVAPNDKATARQRELESKMKAVRGNRNKIDEYIKEFLDGVFVHRFRDLDALIRAECINSLGIYFKKYPSYFLSSSYLRYVGWVLSDQATSVRSAAVRALQTVYTLASSENGEAEHLQTTLNHFTERFKVRLLEMAQGDTDIGVRVGVLRVLEEIDHLGLLTEEDRDKLGSLVFSEEARVRKAVGGFVKGVWEEWMEEAVQARNNVSSTAKRGKKDVDKERLAIKGLCHLLVKWGSILDDLLGDEDAEEDNIEETGEISTATAEKRSKAIAALAASTTLKPDAEGRTSMAVEALWDDLECVSNWKEILDLLLLDHSAAGEDPSPSRRRPGRSKKDTVEEDNGDDAESVQIDESWRLEDVEEGVLLEVLVASITKTLQNASSNKKTDEETIVNDITRSLIKALPRFFIKYQTDMNKITQVVLLPSKMNVDLYLEMRMLPEYAKLWDDLIKQYVTHTSPTILSVLCKTICTLMDSTSLANTNSAKIVELEEELSTSLRDTVGGRDDIETTSFTEDEIHSLTAQSMRLRIFSGMRNISSWMDEDDGGKQSSAWDIFSTLAERGRLGYREEELMIDQILQLLTLHVIWKATSLPTASPLNADEERFREVLILQRDGLIEKLLEYAIGTQSNTVEGVKRSAFKSLLDLHVLFATPRRLDDDTELSPTDPFSLHIHDETQYRCAGYVQAEIEQYAEQLFTERHAISDSEDGADLMDAPANGKNKKKIPQEDEDMTSRTRLAEEYAFIDVVSTFLRSIRAGVIHIQHGAVLLSSYGRLGSSFDSCTKLVIELLREEGLLHGHNELISSTVITAMQDAFEFVLNGTVRDENCVMQLAKLLKSCFVIRGSQLVIIRRLPSGDIVQIHIALLNWIGRRLNTYSNVGNKQLLKKAILFFKPLALLLVRIDSNEALNIKAHLDQTLAQDKLVTDSKIWDPERVYEKRLTSLITKAKGGSGNRQRRKGKKKGMVTSDEDESEVEHFLDEIREATEEPIEHPLPESGVETRPDEEITKKQWKTPKKAIPLAEPSETVTSSGGRHTRPRGSNRKRRREEEEEGEEEMMNGSRDPVVESEPPQTIDRQDTPVGEMVIRRKRVRR